NLTSRNLSSRPAPIRITGVAVSGSEVTVTFDQAVMRSGVPQYTFGGVAPESVFDASPSSVMLLYADAPVATDMIVPLDDPAIRNATGGFVDEGAYPTGAAGAMGEMTLKTTTSKQK